MPACCSTSINTRCLDVNNDPLYPFGYGLSYTSFSYSEPQLSKTTINPAETLQVQVDVRNTGNYDGEEVVQLYLQDEVGSINRPVKERKGIQKIFLKKGESETLTFNITPDDLKFYNNELQLVLEPGDFKVYIGTSPSNVKAADSKVAQ